MNFNTNEDLFKQKLNERNQASALCGTGYRIIRFCIQIQHGKGIIYKCQYMQLLSSSTFITWNLQINCNSREFISCNSCSFTFHLQLYIIWTRTQTADNRLIKFCMHRNALITRMRNAIIPPPLIWLEIFTQGWIGLLLFNQLTQLSWGRFIWKQTNIL